MPVYCKNARLRRRELMYVPDGAVMYVFKEVTIEIEVII